MTRSSTHEVTELLIEWSNGDKAALDKLMPLIHEELRRLAHHYMSHERPGHTLQTTALVNEAYLRLVNRKGVHWQNRAHFFAIAATLMRSILVDHARSHAFAKRGGGAHKIALDDAMVVSQKRAAEVVALDDALKRLNEIDPQQSQIVEMKFFGGLTIEETAEVLGLSPATIKREWSSAKAWLYLAQDKHLLRKVALKTLPGYLTRDEELVRRFQREARSVSALNHPNILTIHEIGEVDSCHFMVTEFIEGETLRQRLTRGPLKIEQALDIGSQVASALCAAHDAGLTHRDIKPENIMMRKDGIVKVLDFGLAKLTERKADDSEATTLFHTKQGTVLGTAHYMSPEQARGLPLDARTDIFSFGVVLYEMVAGKTPFAGETTTDVLASILTVEPPPLSSSRPQVPPELDQITKKAMGKAREVR